MQQKTVEGRYAFDPVREDLFVETRGSGGLMVPSDGDLRTMVRGTHAITWIREAGAMVQFLHGGRVLKRGEQHSDYYGFLTSPRGLVQEIGETLESYAVDRASTLQVRIVAWLEDTPTLGFAGKAYLGRDAYHALPADTQIYQAGDISGESHPIQDFWKLLEKSGEPRWRLQRFSHSQTEVWCSHSDEAENAAALAAFEEMARRRPRIVGEPFHGA